MPLQASIIRADGAVAETEELRRQSFITAFEEAGFDWTVNREVFAASRRFGCLKGQPTRGVDIGSIEIIHRRLLALREAGIAILLVSVELEEIRTLADRVLVMCGGRITGEVGGEDFDIARIGLMMGGVTSEAVAVNT